MFDRKEEVLFRKCVVSDDGELACSGALMMVLCVLCNLFHI